MESGGIKIAGARVLKWYSGRMAVLLTVIASTAAISCRIDAVTPPTRVQASALEILRSRISSGVDAPRLDEVGMCFVLAPSGQPGSALEKKVTIHVDFSDVEPAPEGVIRTSTVHFSKATGRATRVVHCVRPNNEVGLQRVIDRFMPKGYEDFKRAREARANRRLASVLTVPAPGEKSVVNPNALLSSIENVTVEPTLNIDAEEPAPYVPDGIDGRHAEAGPAPGVTFTNDHIGARSAAMRPIPRDVPPVSYALSAATLFAQQYHTLPPVITLETISCAVVPDSEYPEFARLECDDDEVYPWNGEKWEADNYCYFDSGPDPFSSTTYGCPDPGTGGGNTGGGSGSGSGNNQPPVCSTDPEETWDPIAGACVPVTPTIFDECSADETDSEMSTTDSTWHYTDLSTAPPGGHVVCEGAGAKACIESNPGVYVASWPIPNSNGVFMHTGIVRSPPMYVAELLEPVGWPHPTSILDPVRIHIDSVPYYSHPTSNPWTAYKFVRVDTTTTANDFAWKVHFASTQWEGEIYKFSSNQYSSGVLKELGITLTRSQMWLVGWAPGLCKCGTCNVFAG